MKHSILYHSAGLILLMFALHSCSDYLKEDSGDLLIPEKAEEYLSVLYGEGYPNSFTEDVDWMDLMTDDVEVSTSSQTGYGNYEGDDTNNIPSGKGAFSWALDIEYYMPSRYAAPYRNRYTNIMACNIIIENGNNMIGEQATINSCLAQAYTLRAFNYFCLVNWYGMPYNKETASTDPGVPLRLKSNVVRDQPKRNTVAEVYQLINNDLDKALELFDNASPNKNFFTVSKKAALLLKTRVALFTEQWDDVIRFGKELEDDGFTLYDLSKKTQDELNYSTTGIDNKFCFLTSKNPEIIFSFSESGSRYPSMMEYAGMMAGASFVPSQTRDSSLIKSYEHGDNRLYAFFMQNDTIDKGSDYRKIPYKYIDSNGSRKAFTQAFRTAEALLNMAEAYIQRNSSGDKTEAISLLNKLREKRFTPDAYKPLAETDFSTDTALLDFCREERRRELCFEETHRWMDLRREGMPRIEHIYYSSKNASPEKYVLEQNDRNYTLELPKIETSYNTQIEPINRHVIEAQ